MKALEAKVGPEVLGAVGMVIFGAVAPKPRGRDGGGVL